MMMSVARRLRTASATEENTRTPRGRQGPDDTSWARVPLTIPQSIRNVDDVDVLPQALQSRYPFLWLLRTLAAPLVLPRRLFVCYDHPTRARQSVGSRRRNGRTFSPLGVRLLPPNCHTIDSDIDRGRQPGNLTVVGGL